MARTWRPTAVAVALLTASMLAGGSASATRSKGFNTLDGVVAISAKNAWAVGYFHGSDGKPHLLIEHWNGTAWRLAKAPTINGLSSLAGVTATSASNVWVVGAETISGKSRPLFMHFNGSGWKIVTSPTIPEPFFNLAAISADSTSDAWAVGEMSDQSGNLKTLAIHWNGTKWSIVPSPTPGSSRGSQFLSVDTISRTNAWGVGFLSTASFQQRAFAEHWNGSKWSVVTAAGPSGGSTVLYGVSAVSSTVWSVGTSQAQPPGGQINVLTERFSSGHWVQVKDPGGSRRQLNAVSVISGANVWAAGTTFPQFGGGQHTFIQHWNGTAWSVVSSPSVGSLDNVLLAIDQDGPTDVWAVGQEDTSGTAANTLIEHWNGSAWTVVTSPNGA